MSNLDRPDDFHEENCPLLAFKKTGYGPTDGRTDGPSNGRTDGLTIRPVDGPTDGPMYC